MLNQLHVKNFALIEDIVIKFGSGLNIITGETGAGKSILLGALGMLSGKRADLNAVRSNAKKCVIEGVFDLKEYNLVWFFETHDLDFEEETLIRREISSNGKSRAFVNDTPVNLKLLSQLGALLIDVHSQHANLLIKEPAFIFGLLDSYGGIASEVKSFENNYKTLQAKKRELDAFIVKQERQKLNLEFNQFQYKELNDSNLKPGEDVELEQEFELLNNVEEIKANASTVVNSILYNTTSVQGELELSIQSLEKLAAIDSAYDALKERLNSALIDIKDVAEEVEGKTSKLSNDSARAQQIDERLGLIFSLQKKHNVATYDQLIDKRDALASEIDLVVGGDEATEALEAEIKKLATNLNEEAKKITKSRQKVSKEIATIIIADLVKMGIPNAQLSFDFEQVDLNKFGCDQITLMFNANKGKLLGRLDKTASGGEMSRVMLSLKKVLSSKKSLPTIVFDEIDTGVSGEVANQMGRIMNEMSSEMQVVAITHLPQIASKGSNHFKVFKNHNAVETSSSIKPLFDKERVEEIAQMLSGATITELAMKNAEELLKQL